ncbi:uncharacterized, partial [Tachysurus ichikawai]
VKTAATDDADRLDDPINWNKVRTGVRGQSGDTTVKKKRINDDKQREDERGQRPDTNKRS